ncbi:LysR family transcriptional regulator [Paracoccus sp. S1E-3]|uniref:LysR family transcriptional regulator n=1 Tax=Paracoccus sp. S1E-3 TaxID=2756130 RepID=UPI0021030A8B|nr:LysR family transcriptional regulator [Paracoccus sp. S1E-3]
MISENGRLRWDDARVFLAIARGGTLSAAAAQLGLGLATVSRQIERLEAVLGLTLFSRHQSGYRLTDDGAALLDRAAAMEQAAAAFAEGSAAQAEVAGRVRLATAEMLASALIIPALPALRRRHPDLALEIATDVRAVNLHRRDADLAIRMVKPERGNVTLRRLGRLGFGLYGAPAYLAARPFTGLGGHDLIGWCETRAHLPAAQWIERALRGRPPALATTTLGAQLVAAKAGLGLAVLPHFLGAPDGLICVQPELGVDQEIWLAVHADLARTPRVRVVADFLAELIHASRAALEGSNRPETPATEGS